MIQSSRLQQRKLQHGKEMVIAVKKSSKKVILAVVIVLGILVLDAWRSGKIKWYTLDEQEMSQTASDTKSVKITKQTSSRQKKQKKVRVLLSTTGFTSLYHDKVCVSGTKGLQVRKGNHKVTYSAKEQLTFLVKEDGKDSRDKITIQPKDGGKITVHSIKRQDRTPSYRGEITLLPKKNGFLVRNSLPLEQYLYAVVPSELSTSNGMEALRAQAVCARTYANNQIAAHRYKKYHADLEDSTACQVYNNIPEDKQSKKAVDTTKDQVLTSDGKRIQTYYYSTSWGKSASGKEVWETDREVDYLQSCMQQDGGKNKTLRLSEEKQFREFIAKKTDAAYDKDSKWYRWWIRINAKQLSASIDNALQQCYATDPNKILMQRQDGTYHSAALSSVGTVRGIRVEKRGESGIVTKLVVIGSKSVVLVCSQYNIRKVLAAGQQITAHLTKGTAKLSLLPSAAFYIDTIKEKGETIFELHGGGFGHGTGMSQTGAAVMAQKGKNYRQILSFYFDGCELSAK